MMKILMLVVLLAIFCYSQAAVGTPCGKKSQCAAQECCQILNDVFVASKRRQLDVPTGGAGTCQLYKQEGDTCDSMAEMNGFCPCADGLSCQVFDREPVHHHHVDGRREALPPQYVERCAPSHHTAANP